MDSGLFAFRLAAGIAITCLLIFIGASVGRQAQSLGAESISNLNDTKLQWDASDKLLYDGLSCAGSEVVNAVRKFQREITVTVITPLGTTQYPIPGEVGVVNDPSSVKYIEPNDMYTCEVTKSSDGLTVTQMTFTADRLTASSEPDSITDIDVAKATIVAALGDSATAGMTWEDIAVIVKSNGENMLLKRELVGSIGGTVNTSMSWLELATEAVDKIESLENKMIASGVQDGYKYTRYQRGSILGGASAILGFSPEVIIVVDDSTGNVSCYQRGVWFGQDTYMIEDNVLQNLSDNAVSYYIYE